MKIAIFGGTGFIGEYLTSFLINKGNEIHIFSRSNINNNEKSISYHLWNGKTLLQHVDLLNEIECFINLSGTNVSVKHTKLNKQKIISSRVESTKAIGNVIQVLTKKPKIWINASGDAIYKDKVNQYNTEFDTDADDTFLSQVVQKWEEAQDQFDFQNVKKLKLRTSVVFGNGGALKPLQMMAKFGFGGKQGHGNQMMSWIHIEDYCRIIEFAISHNLEGVLNCSSSFPVTNKELMTVLRKLYKPLIAIPTPTWFWNLSGLIAPVETSLILSSRNVVSKRLEDLGFQFKFEKIELALSSLK